ncbi:hypothetical protein D9M68_874810 [compost metagenome]
MANPVHRFQERREVGRDQRIAEIPVMAHQRPNSQHIALALDIGQRQVIDINEVAGPR